MPPRLRALGLWCTDACREPNVKAWGRWIHKGCRFLPAKRGEFTRKSGDFTVELKTVDFTKKRQGFCNKHGDLNNKNNKGFFQPKWE